MKNAVIVITPCRLKRAVQCCSAAGHKGHSQGGVGARCLISNYALGWKYTNKSVAKVGATLPVYLNC